MSGNISDMLLRAKLINMRVHLEEGQEYST